MDWVYYLLLVVVSLTGLVLAVIGLPGIWLIVAATAVYALLTGSAYAGLKTLIALIALGVVAEILETTLGGAAAAKAGGSKRGIAAAILGGIAGAILGTPLIPIPIVGTIVGACLGSFLATFATELLWIKRDAKHSLKISTNAAAGKLAGIVTKLVFGTGMLLVAVVVALPVSCGGPTVIPSAATIPTTSSPTTSSPTTAPTTLP